MKTYNLAHSSNYHKSKVFFFFLKFLNLLLLIIKWVIPYIKLEH